MLAALGLIMAFAAPTLAEEKEKEVTLKGTICCAKCELNVAKACATVIKVKGKDGKDMVYYFDAASHKANHGKICQEAKDGSVVGTVKKDGDKMIVTASKVEFK
jgi:hypothetical protein